MPVAFIGATPFVIAANPSFPAKTVPELVAYAKANPGKVNFASSGVGSGPHVSAELLKMMTGIDIARAVSQQLRDRPARRPDPARVQP